ncbi:hypothetical protein BFN03_08370 [Rhodococcus sp. WMMA185]|uniref:nitroreductase family deazaflavin-dependent oxidoreductase n=1 Tax=Rhodococcus sp. WMMA185 TaxID=679318 RepID=UPI0008786C36|nr:nitroreductase family deazaflavin-dependent oxidoreductase [Rhodococcus sp. WMMA185]AOW94633.1 hypothetical protein BFN03_08370 [Rhodococcus sp. WMMA185]
MVLPRSMARFNRVATNQLTRGAAKYLPGFAVVEHRGRRSGRAYRTPVNVFVEGGHYRFALTYGDNSDWVKNVVGAGGCTIETRHRTVELIDPKIVEDGSHAWAPPGVRTVLRAISADTYLDCVEA